MSSNKTFVYTGEAVEPHRDLADKFKANFKVEGATISEVQPRTVYESHLPDGIDMATVKKLSAYNTQVVLAARLAAAEISAGEFAKDPNLTKTEARVGFFNNGDYLDIASTRHRSFGVPSTGVNGVSSDAPPVEHLMVQRVSIHYRGQSGQKLTAAISEQSANFFSK